MVLSLLHVTATAASSPSVVALRRLVEAFGEPVTSRMNHRWTLRPARPAQPEVTLTAWWDGRAESFDIAVLAPGAEYRDSVVGPRLLDPTALDEVVAKKSRAAGVRVGAA